MLTADMHLHTNADPQDTWIKHSGEQLLDHLSLHGYRVASITCHDHNAYTPELAAYARRLGMVLIPGCERTIEGKHVLLYNFSTSELNHIRTFDDLRALKRERHCVVAPHPYFPIGKSVGPLLEKYRDVFDAIEHHSFYMNGFDFNALAIKKARALNLPMMGNSDTHSLGHVWGQNYSLIDAKPKVEAVLRAIKRGAVRVRTKPMGFERFLRHGLSIVSGSSLVAEKLLKPLP